MDGPWDIDPDEEEAMIAEQAEHDAAAADAAAAEYEANEKKRPRTQDVHALRRRDARRRSGGGDEQVLPLRRNRTLGEGLPQEGQDAPAVDAPAEPPMPRQEVRPHDSRDVAVGVEIKLLVDVVDSVVDVQHRSRRTRTATIINVRSAPASSGSTSGRESRPPRSGARRRGQEAPVGRELLQVRCCRTLGARTDPVSLDPSRRWRGGGVGSQPHAIDETCSAQDCPTNKAAADKPEEEEFPARECEKGCGPLSIRTARPEQNSGRKYYKSARGVLLYLRLASVAATASRRAESSYVVDATRFPQVHSCDFFKWCNQMPAQGGGTAAARPAGTSRPGPAAAAALCSSAGKRATGPAIVPTRARASAAPTGRLGGYGGGGARASGGGGGHRFKWARAGTGLRDCPNGNSGGGHRSRWMRSSEGGRSILLFGSHIIASSAVSSNDRGLPQQRGPEPRRNSSPCPSR